MKIECTIKRELERKGDNGRILKDGPGTVITMGEATYVFKPEDPADKEGTTPHVCDVNDPDHIARFKEIPESFKPAGNAKWPKALPKTTIGKVEEQAEDEKDDDDFGAHVSEGDGDVK